MEIPTPKELRDLVARAPKQRRFVSITRTSSDGYHTIDAIDDEGQAWWLIAGCDHAPEDWTKHQPLPLKLRRSEEREPLRFEPGRVQRSNSGNPTTIKPTIVPKPQPPIGRMIEP